MSATLGDVTQIADLLRRQTTRDVSNVTDAPRPVPLSYEYALTPLEGTVELALRKDEGPLYVVHFSQDAALTSAQNLASYGVATKEQREAVKEAMKGAQFSTAFGKTLKRLLGCGVGVHHAGMLPRYRLLVEKLAQQGLLPVICGTDTLGVGINVPIHTVVLTQLTKFDGRKMRRLRSREFHQIAGRAGRSGFDTEGVVIAEAPEHEIENHKAEVKAAGDPKKLKKIKKKRPPENFVNWNEDTFNKLIESVPEQLTPRMRITHSMVLAEVEQGGNARARVDQLIEDSLQPAEEKVKLHVRAAEVLQTLIDADVVVHEVDENGEDVYSVTMDLPEDFALDQPLSPFLLAALELLDPESPEYAFDLVSMVEATLEDPRQVLRAQERKARDAAMAEMKMDGVDYDERLERIADVTYPKPLEDLLDAAFSKYCDAVPWARDYCLRPKSVLRDMLESAADFKGYIQKLGIMRYEGILLRYLSEAFRGLDRTIPEDKRTEQLKDIIAWLGLIVRSVDSSLVDEWENAGAVLDAAPPDAAGVEAVVRDRRGLTVLVRNALFSRVRMAAHRDAAGLGEADGDWGFGERAWMQALDEYYETHEEILLDADARSKAYLMFDEADEEELRVWHVRQIFHDEAGDNDFVIVADVDLDATQEGDGVVFANYRVGFADELLDEF